MEQLVYDGSFEGFLTVVFECYARKMNPIDICSGNSKYNLFAEKYYIDTDIVKADRVWKGMRKRLNGRNQDLPLFSFLSELPGIEMKLYNFARLLFDSTHMVETDYGNPVVLDLVKIERKVKKDAMRILQFVRFQKTKDDMFYAPVEPESNVLPLAISHFKSRFADQRWLLYDIKRDYGFFYDLHNVHEVSLVEKSFSEDGQLSENLLAEEEVAYQSLWQDYYKHINIKERKNLKLQRQHMPRRYWKFLPEKQRYKTSDD
jgi:probable DNA metabolism protein